jgi:Tfp pilus assembly protein PilF
MSLKNKLLICSLCLQSALCVQAAHAAESVSFTASPAYQECSALAASDPAAALTKADSWLKIDDSVAAHHCRAMALYGLKHYDKAASELDGVRLKIDPADITLRTYVTQQTARAWVSANKPENALHVLGEQVNEMTMTRGDNVTQAKLATDLLLDRSRIRMNYGQLAEAVQDLDQAISLSPGNEDVLVERAKIFSQLGDNALAQRDLQVVLRMNPKHAEAIGLMRVLRDTK